MRPVVLVALLVVAAAAVAAYLLVLPLLVRPIGTAQVIEIEMTTQQ